MRRMYPGAAPASTDAPPGAPRDGRGRDAPEPAHTLTGMQDVGAPRSVAIVEAPASTSAIAASNQGGIIEVLRAHGPLPKARISELTGLSPATVSRLLKGLVGRGFVERTGTEESSGGRPPVVLGVAGRALASGAVQVHQDRVVGALVGFDGAILERHERAVVEERPEAGPRALREMIARLEARAGALGVALHAVGVSIAGVAHRDGVISGLDARRWPELPAAELVGEAGVPVVVENDANVLALGELYRGAGRGARHFVALVLDRGLGSGVVANGELYRGARSAAGEVGHLLVAADTFARRPSGQGELEALLEPAAVTAAARAAGIDLGRELTAADIIALDCDGDPRAAGVASAVLDGLARAVAALASILDPELILLGEGLDVRAEAVIPALRRRLEGRVQAVPEIRTAALGSDAVLLGAAEMALRAVPAPVPLSR